MLYRKFYKNAQPVTLLHAVARILHLEYRSAVWDPCLTRDMELLENIQKLGLKFNVCMKNWSLWRVPSSSLKQMFPPWLRGIPKLGSAIYMYKTMHKETGFPRALIENSVYTSL